MRFDKFTLKLQEAFQDAEGLAGGYGHQGIDAEHILLALIRQPEGTVSEILKKVGAEPEKLAGEIGGILEGLPKVSGAGQPYLTPRLNDMLNKALTEAAQLGDEYVSVEHVLISIADDRVNPAGKALGRRGVTRDAILMALLDIRGNQRITDPNPEDKYQTLKRFARDFNELALQGKFDPVIGRDDEIRRIMQVLSRRTKNNPVLIGEPGVGKTAIAEGLAQRIINGDVPDSLKSKRVV
ncbi:MAG: type VI secretion system ATPase TssH, partial [Deltaproteobacteria bacterium]|nr:type VI secretion system ATPase TssH [Deltaproteobacteria bacterium]